MNLSLIMFKITVRAVIGVMIFFGYFLIYEIRYNLSVHVVDMAHILGRDPDIVYNMSANIQRQTIVKARVVGARTQNFAKAGAIDIIKWDDTKMGKLLASYHIGYCVCFPIFHSYGDRIGPKWVVGITAMTSGVLTCLTPAAAINFWGIFFVRMITGFCAGATQPSMVQVLRHWVPPIERNHFMWAYCGITMGTCSTFLICGVVQYYARWPLGFYVSGALQIAWSVLWVLLVTDSPRTHPYISKKEQTYLENTIGDIFTIKLTNSEAPWKSILLSIPFWALCILNFGYAWMVISLATHGPLFYTRIVGYSIYTASTLTALPFLLRLVLGTIVIQTYHWYTHNVHIRRIKHIRKYFIVVSHVIPGLLVAACWMFSVIPGPILLTTAVALTAAGMDLTLDLCYHMTPTFVNSVHTVIKIIGNTAGIIVSLCVGQVTYTFKNSPIVWKHIWCFHATVLFISGVVFLIWGDIEVQPWSFRRARTRRRKKFCQKVSMMSNITEVEENSGILKISQSLNK